jgi:quercetin dioxygenase-like cupin family protein
MSATTIPLKDNPRPNRFIVVGDDISDLDVVANQLREEIPSPQSGQPQLAKRVLATQAGVMEVLLVVRGQEIPHTHPNADLIFTLLEGEGWLQRSSVPNPEIDIEVMAGTTVVVPKGVCHAFHNTSGSDSVLLATFSPADPSHVDGCGSTS